MKTRDGQLSDILPENHRNWWCQQLQLVLEDPECATELLSFRDVRLIKRLSDERTQLLPTISVCQHQQTKLLIKSKTHTHTPWPDEKTIKFSNTHPYTHPKTQGNWYPIFENPEVKSKFPEPEERSKFSWSSFSVPNFYQVYQTLTTTLVGNSGGVKSSPNSGI